MIMSEIEDIIINEINEFYINEQVHDEELDDDLPKSLIITGVPEVVYTDASVKVCTFNAFPKFK